MANSFWITLLKFIFIILLYMMIFELYHSVCHLQNLTVAKKFEPRHRKWLLHLLRYLLTIWLDNVKNIYFKSTILNRNKQPYNNIIQNIQQTYLDYWKNGTALIKECLKTNYRNTMFKSGNGKFRWFSICS